jgi:hypothetical protein
MKFGNLFTTKDWAKYRTFSGHEYWANQPEYSLKHMLISKITPRCTITPRWCAP